ncbi:MAG: CHAT domain-containing protein, partial [Anaerolineae bacterium]
HWQRAVALTAEGSPDLPSRLNNLASGLSDRYGRSGELADLEAAIGHWQRAVALTAEGSPDLPSILNNLASGLSDRYARIGALADLEDAIAAFEQAMTLCSPQMFPEEALRAGRNLGDVHYDQQAWHDAYAAYAQHALPALETVHGATHREAAKRKLGEENAQLYSRTVHCALTLAQAPATPPDNYPARAFEYAEMAKGRAFLDSLGRVLPEEADFPSNLEARIRQVEALQAERDVLLLGREQPDGRPSPARQVITREAHARVQELEAQIDAVWAGIRHDYPQYFDVTAGRVEPLTAAQAQALAVELDATLVTYYRHAEGWVAFVVTPAGLASPVPLNFTDEEAADWWNLLWSRMLRPGGPYPAAAVALDRMYATLFDPLRPYLPARGRLIFSPHSFLHLFPLHAMRTVRDGRPRYVLDDFVVGYAPSLSALQRCREMNPGRRRSFLGVAHPGEGEERLKFVIPEVQAEAALPGWNRFRTLVEEKATWDAVRAEARHFDVLHLACHALLREELERTALWLHESFPSVREIVHRLRLRASLLVYAACGTHLARPDAADELAGLVRAGMIAGAPAVIASQWPVNDAATAVLFTDFYRRFTAGEPVAEALRAAQLYVRDEVEGAAHPYYWAAFVASGAVWEWVGGQRMAFG